MKNVLLIALLAVGQVPVPDPAFTPAPVPIVRQPAAAYDTEPFTPPVIREVGEGEVELVVKYSKVLFDAPTIEYVLPDGRRVDVLTDRFAYEADWSTKWTEGIGQALAYGLATDRNPGLILFMKGPDDERYNQCLGVVTHLRTRGYNFDFIVINVENGKIWRH